MTKESSRRENWRGARPSARPSPTAPSAGRSRGRRLIPLAAVLLVLLSLLVGFLSLRGSAVQPELLSLVLAQSHDESWPVIPYAKQETARLLNQAERSRNQTDLGISAELDQAISKAVTAKKPLIIHLLCRCVLTGEGPQLVMSNSSFRQANFLSLVKGVLEPLDQKKHECLLLLDLRTVAVPWLGGLGELDRKEILDALQRYYDQHSESKLVTMAYVHAGTAQTVPVEAQSCIFSIAFEEALQGYASNWKSGDRDRHVSVQELARYVKSRIQSWNQQEHLPGNLPLVLGQADFPLITQNRPARDPQIALHEAKEQPYPKELSEGWLLRDRAKKELGEALAPNLFRRLEYALTRAEQYWMGGNLERGLNVLKDEQKEIAGLLEKRQSLDPTLLTRLPADPPPDPPSKDAPAKDPKKSLDAVRLKLQQLAAEDVKAEDWKAFLAESGPAAREDRIGMARLLLQNLQGPTLQPYQLRKLRELLDKAEYPEFAEMLWLRTLAESQASLENQPKIASWHSVLPQLARLGLAQLSAAPIDARAWEILRPALVPLDEKWLVIVAGLYNPSFVSDDRALLIKELPGLASGYQRLLQQGNMLAQAFRERDACMELLPHLAYYDPPDPSIARQVQAQWEELLEALRPLVANLQTATAANATIWEPVLQDQSEQVGRLRRALSEKLQEISMPGLAPLRRMSLSCPLLPLKTRQERFQESFRAELPWLQQRPDFLETSNMALGTPELSTAQPAHLARRASDLLDLANATVARQIKTRLAEAEQSAGVRQGIRDQLAQAWRQLPASLVSGERPVEVESISWMWYAPSFGVEFSRDPILAHRMSARVAVREATAQRYLKMEQVLRPVNPKLADSYRNLTAKLR